MDIYCTRPHCTKPLNSFADLDSGNTLKTITQKFCTACGMPLLLGGRYIVERPIAQGGFGATFLARDRYTPAMKRCVVKLLQPVGLTSSQMVIAKQMFEREATVLEDLGTHPQIPDLLAYFEVQSGQDEFFYLVQEFVDGFTLEQIVEQHGAIAEADVLEIMQSLLPVLTFIHEKGSIHRDIKPANIMVRKLDQTYFLLDFGAVKQVAGAAQGQKSTGIFTPGYGAPEQMRGDTVFPATDLYAFAVTCLFLLTGKEPEELFDVSYNKWQWDRFVKLSPSLNSVLHKMLETAPSDRFNSAASVIQALSSKIAATAPTPVKPTHQTSIQVPVPIASPNAINAPSVPKVLSKSPKPQKTPWLLSAPIPTQFIAAFLLGVEAMLLWQVSTTVGITAIGSPANLVVFAAFLLGVILLRISSVLDNKDLFVFVNLLSFAAVWAGQFFAKTIFQNLPQWVDIIQYCGVAGFSAIALMAAFRLIFQLLYSLL
ncbi:serine/threonine-protein kinase [Pseudanabaena galeata UHCC 0370]|uniref:non-specific serine/threonine protein kinase n=1 Tax=Pseudanabaena galeata UHCC 0370 TaxID=3110310 RepID=A0ABU5TJ71_9CYAN|nr:serine/threonine-protein kinase [Pseudanabaena galeata]MEA5478373.1 serine/threonine-protein kinase [Pseudanabaena galeata UHCC 0370]